MVESNFAAVDFQAGQLIVDVSCTGGEITVRGIGKLINYSNVVIDSSGLLSIDSIFNESISEHDIPGSVGKAISNASSAGDPWSTELPGDYVEGSAGAMIKKIEKLSAENQALILS